MKYKIVRTDTYNSLLRCIDKALQNNHELRKVCQCRKLTLDELRKMDGQPVWVKLIHNDVRKRSPMKKNDIDGWYIIYCSEEFSTSKTPYAVRVDEKTFFDGSGYMLQEGILYGETWVAYNRQPEGDRR